MKAATKPSQPQLPTPDPDLPVVESLGIVRTKAGWTLVWLRSQGRVVVDEEVLAGPESSRGLIFERFKIEAVNRIHSMMVRS